MQVPERLGTRLSTARADLGDRFTTARADLSDRLSAIRWQAMLVPHRLALLGITLVSAFFNLWMLGQNGYGNLYYAAAVKSMGNNWHAFFFVSLDSAGFVTVDKPPVGFWLQVLSTKVLGFTPFAVFLPQALAGIASVVLLYWLVRRHFGRVAGLISALALAASPISVVTNRNNTIDSTLMLALLLAAWATFRAIETDKLLWLVGAAVLVGIGFNIKMLEAYLVVPAFGLTYLLSSQKSWLQRAGQLAASGAALAAVSLAWVVGVDLIPAALRPWVGSTANNSEISLAFGYNGLQRLTGNSGGGAGRGAPGGGFPGGAGGFPGGAPPEGFVPPEGFPGRRGGFPGGTRPEGFPAGGFGGGTARIGGGGGMFNTGDPGIFRLFTNPLGGQIVWLLPLALIGLVALASDRRFRPRADRQQQSMLLWGTWLLTMAIFFSVATFFHQYYLSQMSPAIAALAGIGVVTMWNQFALPGWRGWLLPFALAVTAWVQIAIIRDDPSWGAWLVPVIAIPSLVAVVALILMRARPALLTTRPTVLGLMNNERVRAATVAVGLAALLATPFVWSAYPALTNLTQDLPLAGSATSGFGGLGNAQTDAALISYLEAHQGKATYLVATTSSGTSAPIILATDRAVMTLGGFSGSDPILTVAQLQSLVSKGTVRYFLLGGFGGFGGGATTTEATPSYGETTTGVGTVGTANGQGSVTQWVQANCTAVAASAYQATQTTGGQQLYDCAGK